MPPDRPRTAPRVFASARSPAIQVQRTAATAGVCRPAAFDRWTPGLYALDDGAPNVITVYEPIGEDFWTGGGVTSKGVASKLRAMAGQDIEVHINSPGGDMWEGIGIHNLLCEHRGRVTVKVLGLAASAASIIAMAGDEILVGPASFVMIHNAWIISTGNRHDMLDTAAMLEPFDAAMAGLYARRTGQSVERVAAWMDANAGDGTYFSTAQALEFGFAQGTIEPGQVAESAEARASGRAKSDLLKAELALCAQMPRSEARALLNKIKGRADAAPEPGKPDAAEAAAAKPDAGAVDLSWIGAAAGLSALLRQ